ncbi:MAG: winged helix DNA-binding protein [archaeon]|nr:winged helix DNA-binding protein [archaeon]
MKFNKEKLYNQKLPIIAYISIISRQYYSYLNKIASEKDISAGQTFLLLYLLDVKTCSQNEIADNYRIDKGSIARSIKKLEDKEIVQREIDDSNRKKYRVSLTEKGKKMAEYIKQKIKSGNKSH